MNPRRTRSKSRTPVRGVCVDKTRITKQEGINYSPITIPFSPKRADSTLLPKRDSSNRRGVYRVRGSSSEIKLDSSVRMACGIRFHPKTWGNGRGTGCQRRHEDVTARLRKIGEACVGQEPTGHPCPGVKMPIGHCRR